MNSRQRIIFSLAGIFVFLLSVPIAYSDVYWEADQVVRGIPGRADKHTTIRNYFTPTACRSDIGENITIADFDAMTGYVISSSDRMYFKVDMYNEGIIDPSLRQEIEVMPTNETRHIAGYRCRKYNVRFMGRSYEEWLSKDVPAYQELRAVNEQLAPLMRQHPLFQMSIIGRMHKLDGFPVKMVMNLDGGVVKTVTLRKVSTRELSRSVFTVPKGYRTP
jgi:hypothetical protein